MVRRGGGRAHLTALRNTAMLRALLPVALFEFGNVVTTLLILRTTLQYHHAEDVLMAFLHNRSGGNG